MTDEPQADPAPVPPELKQLEKIAEHLGSIRSMLKFFTFLAILMLFIGACTALTSI